MIGSISRTGIKNGEENRAQMPSTTTAAHRWWALLVLLMGAFLSPLDFFIVNVALPSIKNSLGATDGELQFVIAGYGAAYAVFVVTGGRLGDIYGRKKVFLTGMALFTITSAICAFAPVIEVLIAARIVQGLAAALLAPQVLSSIRVIFPVAEQPRAMGFFGATFGLAAIAGQLLGGLLIQTHPFGWSWETVFMINIPIGGITMLLAMFILPENQPTNRPKLDIPGMLLISLALALFIYPLIKGREEGWPAWVFICMAMAIPVLYAFIRVEKKTMSDPLIHLPLFGNKHFVIGLGIIMLFNATASFFMIYPFYLQNGLHWNVMRAGMSVLPYAMGFFIGPLSSAYLTRKVGAEILKIGLVLLFSGFVMAITGIFLDASPGWLINVGLFCAGIGHGIVMPSVVRMVLAPIAIDIAGQAAGIVSTAIQVGGVMGVALIGTVFFLVLDDAHNIGDYQIAFVISISCLAVALAMAFLLAIRSKKLHENS